VRRMRCEAGGGRGCVFVPGRLASTGRQQCTTEGAELVVCVSVGLPVGLSGALVSWAVLHVELGDGGRAGSTRHTAGAHDVPGCCCCK
jgi:hypothetical protein